MIKTLHVLMSFGHPNQPYTTNLIESLYDKTGSLENEVICSKQIVKSEIIKIKTLSSPKKALINYRVLIFVLKSLFSDKYYKIAIPKATFKTKLFFFLKWEPILNQTVDVVHVHHLHMVPEVLLHYLKLKHIKLVISLRGKELVSDTVLREQNLEFLRKISYFHLVHVISDYMFQVALSKGVEQNKLKLIYRGFDFKQLKTENIKSDFEAINKNTIKALCVGRLAWEKGQFYILDSVFRLKNKGFIVNLDIYGEGPFREFLEYRIHQLELEKQVVLKGHVPHLLLKTYYKDYDLAIQPSLYEALSNGLLDLTFHNVPTVISNQGGMVEIIRDGLNGVIFDICEPLQLDEAIISSLDLNLENLRKYNSRLQEKFSIESEIKGFQSLYSELF